MQRTVALSSVVLFAAALGGALLGSRARAQDPEPAAPAARPAPWEYRVFLMDQTEYSLKDDWKEFRDRAGGNELRADADFRSYVLEHLARDGWELVQVVTVKAKLDYLYLRRPRGSGPPVAPSAPSGEDPKTYPGSDPRPPRRVSGGGH